MNIKDPLLDVMSVCRGRFSLILSRTNLYNMSLLKSAVSARWKPSIDIRVCFALDVRLLKE